MRKTSRASKGLAASLFVIVFLIIRGTRQQRVIRTLLFGLWFPNPFGAVYDWFTAGVQAIPDAIKSWIRSIVFAIGDVFMQLVQDTVNVLSRVFQMLADLAHDVEHTFNVFYGIVQGWVAAAVTLVSGLLHLVASGLYDYINAALRAVIGWITAAGNAVAAAAAHALSAAVDFLRTAIANVGAFAVNLVTQAVQLAANALAAAVDFLRAAIANVGAFAIGLVAQAVHVAQEALTAAYDVIMRLVGAAIQLLHDSLFVALDLLRDYVLDTIRQWVMDLIGPMQLVVDAVGEVLDWIIALAVFPFTTARDIWNAMRSSNGPQVIDGMKQANDRWGDHVTDHMRRYVG